MSLSNSFLNLFAQANQMFPRTTGSSFSFTNKIQLKNGNGHKETGLLIRIAVFVLCTITYVARMFYDKTTGTNTTVIETVERIFMTVICITVASSFYQRLMKSGNLVLFMNGMLETEKTSLIESTCEPDALTRLITSFSYLNEKIVVPFCPIVVAVACALRPKSPINLLSSCLFEMFPDKPVEKLLNLTDTLFNWGTVSYYFALLSLNLLINYVLWLNIFVAGYRWILEQLIGPVSITNAHTNQKRAIIHSISANYSNDGTFGRRTLVSFRSVQILNEYFNSFAQYTLILTFGGCCACEIIGAWILISKNADLSVSFPHKIFFAVILVEGTIANFLVNSLAADLYQQSTKIISFLVTYPCIKRNKYLHKFFTSCRVLRIRFGAANFVDKATPVIMEEFALQRIIELLLLGNRKQ